MSARELGEVAKYVQGNVERTIRIEERQGAMSSTLENIVTEARQTSTATMRLAEIAEKKEAREEKSYQRSESDRHDMKQWVRDNWMMVVLIFTAIFAPSVVPQVVAAMGYAPKVELAQPAPVVVQVPTAVPASAPAEPAPEVEP